MKAQVEDYIDIMTSFTAGITTVSPAPAGDSRFTAWRFVSGDKTRTLLNLVVTHVRGQCPPDLWFSSAAPRPGETVSSGGKWPYLQRQRADECRDIHTDDYGRLSGCADVSTDGKSDGEER